MNELEEPKGIAFFNIDSGETHYGKLEPTISAYINSSDMGINASRGQDFKWRLAADWVKRVRAFRRNRMQMQMLTQMHSGQKPSTVQILYFLYGEDLRAYEEQTDEVGSPYEEQYQRDTADNGKAPVAQEVVPNVIPGVALDPEDVPEGGDEEEIDTDAAAEAATSDKPEKTTAVKPPKK